jgi:hypothetical protein
MTAWKNCPNRYDINLVKAYDFGQQKKELGQRERPFAPDPVAVPPTTA